MALLYFNSFNNYLNSFQYQNSSENNNIESIKTFVEKIKVIYINIKNLNKYKQHQMLIEMIESNLNIFNQIVDLIFKFNANSKSQINYYPKIDSPAISLLPSFLRIFKSYSQLFENNVSLSLYETNILQKNKFKSFNAEYIKIVVLFRQSDFYVFYSLNEISCILDDIAKNNFILNSNSSMKNDLFRHALSNRIIKFQSVKDINKKRILLKGQNLNNIIISNIETIV